MGFIPVLDEKDLPEASQQIVTIDDKEVAVFNVKGKLFAIGNVCLHQGGPLGEGEVDADKQCVTCPWHNWRYDLTTGLGPTPDDQQAVYDVKVEHGKILVSKEPKIKASREMF